LLRRILRICPAQLPIFCKGKIGVPQQKSFLRKIGKNSFDAGLSNPEKYFR
jgi:hypothetical protein